MSTVQITGLYIYPVKSMKGIELRDACLTTRGLENDRRWMVVRSDGRFVTQREIPRLALVQTQLGEEGVVLSLKGHGSISVPWDRVDGERVETKVWHDHCMAVDQGDEISRWLTQALSPGEKLGLVSMDPGFTRSLHKSEILGEETTTTFADAAPFLVANESSLNHLNTILEANGSPGVPMNRFRPNIVLSGLDPFAEHDIDALLAQHYHLKFCAPCERCVITTIDQDTAQIDPHKQPFSTLQTINPMPGKTRAPAFAQYATLSHGNRQNIAVGDTLRCLA